MYKYLLLHSQIEKKTATPIKAVFNGNSKKQTLRAQIFADPKNYISPIKIQQILNLVDK